MINEFHTMTLTIVAFSMKPRVYSTPSNFIIHAFQKEIIEFWLTELLKKKSKMNK